VKSGKLTEAFCLILFAAPLASYSQAPANQAAAGGVGAGAAIAAPEPAAEAPSAAPAGAPNVVCKGNQLTIAANNSSLSSILADVRRCTGAKIDVPDAAADGRFFDTIGPGLTREVLSSLLSATSFNFVIVLSDSDPDKVESVMLMARAAPEGPASAKETVSDSSSRGAPSSKCARISIPRAYRARTTPPRQPRIQAPRGATIREPRRQRSQRRVQSRPRLRIKLPRRRRPIRLRLQARTWLRIRLQQRPMPPRPQRGQTRQISRLQICSNCSSSGVR